MMVRVRQGRPATCCCQPSGHPARPGRAPSNGNTGHIEHYLTVITAAGRGHFLLQAGSGVSSPLSSTRPSDPGPELGTTGPTIPARVSGWRPAPAYGGDAARAASAWEHRAGGTTKSPGRHLPE